MQKAVYLSLADKKLSENSKIQELFAVKPFADTWDTLLYMIDHPEVLLFIYHAHPDPDVNRKVLSTLFELNPVLPIVMLEAQQEEMERYYSLNKNLTFAKHEDEIDEIYQKLKQMQRRHYRTVWPLKINLLLDIDKPLEAELLTLSAGGAYIKFSDFELIKAQQKITLEVNFQDFQFIANAKLIQTFENGQGNLPSGFSIEFIEVTETTRKYIEQIINTKVMNNIMSVFKDS